MPDFRNALLLGMLIFLPSPVAADVFFDRFDEELGIEGDSGESLLNVVELDNWEMVPGGVVDLIAQGDYGGIDCVDGSGKCIDLDGSDQGQGVGALTSFPIQLDPGLYRFSFELSGVASHFTQAAASIPNVIDVAIGSLFSQQITREQGDPYETFGGQFSVGEQTTVRISIQNQDVDFFGAMLDNVELAPGGNVLQAGDADQDLDFDQLDLVQVQIAAKYLNGTPATWGEGDWDGAPGGEPGSPPAGNGFFDQLDIIAALANGLYLTGPYAAITTGGQRDDRQTSIRYDANTGEVAVDAPVGTELTSVNIDSAAGIFTGDATANLGGSFDNDADANIFKATFGGSFGSVSFGNVAQAGLSEEFVLGDLSVVGSLAGGGDLGNVDLVYVPEPTSSLLLAVGIVVWLLRAGRARR